MANENLLYVKMSGGDLLTHCRADQDYSNTQDIIDAMLEQLAPPGTVVGYAIAKSADVRAHIAEHSLSLKDDFFVAEKQNVPVGKMIFLPNGVALEDVPDDQSVLYGNVPE